MLTGMVGYAVGVAMATVAIERTLGEAAAQLDASDAAAVSAAVPAL
ncbi:MAG TPA: hypothetical protein VF228_07150 [Iamia sp.]